MNVGSADDDAVSAIRDDEDGAAAFQTGLWGQLRDGFADAFAVFEVLIGRFFEIADHGNVLLDAVRRVVDVN